MEDDDDEEFGDRYTDVLRPFHPLKQPSPKPPLCVAPNSTLKLILLTTSSHQTQTLVSNHEKTTTNSDSRRNLNLEDEEVEKEEGFVGGMRNSSMSGDDGRDGALVGNGGVLIDEAEDFEKFDIEEFDTGIDNMVGLDLEPLIHGVPVAKESNVEFVLNGNQHMVMERNAVVGSDDEDGDGEQLDIVADSEPGHHQPMEAAQAVDGERKGLGDAGKVNGGAGVMPNIGYSNHTYHQPYHFQFKYVIPGAALIPGADPVGLVGAPGQVCPPVNIGLVSGFGRGDWRPTGIRNASPMQNTLHPGFGVHVWGNNTTGRGSGLDFTLPSHKSIFEVAVDSFEEKPWRLPGLEISDFFNFGLTEESWKDYCKQLEQLRVEATMQSKIRDYKSGRTEQECDPDLPPELAAAAVILDVSPENANLGKTDAGQSNVAKGSSHVRPPLFLGGRAIQVETGYGERLPSVETQPPQIRDIDVVIEIVLQDFEDDSSLPGNDVRELLENDPSKKEFRGGQETQGDIAEEYNSLPYAYNGRKREMVRRRAPCTNSIHDNLIQAEGNLSCPQESSVPCRLNSRAQTTAYPERDVGTLHEERRTKGRARDRSPIMTRSRSPLHKGFLENQKDDSVDSIGAKHSHQLSSRVTDGSAELVLADGSSGMDEREEMALDRPTVPDTHVDENPLRSVKKKKISSPVEQSSVQEIEDGWGLREARSSEDSEERSDSSREFQKFCDRIEEEFVRRGLSKRMGKSKRPHGEDEQSVRRTSRDERHEIEKHCNTYSRRDLDPHLAHQSYVKTEGIDRRKERENSDGLWQKREDDTYGRRAAEETRKRERSEELGSRHWDKVRENEKMDKDEHLWWRKQLDHGNSMGYCDKYVGSPPREKDDNLKSRYENLDELYSNRRKEEEQSRTDAEKEEILHDHRESTSSRKRGRDDALDPRKRDGQLRTSGDNHHSVRHKENGWIQRGGERKWEQNDLHRLKESHEESLLKWEGEGQGEVRSGRGAKGKTRVSHARVKDEYKGSHRDYQFKHTGRRHNEQLKRKDRVEDGSFSQHRGTKDVYAHGSQVSNDERRPRLESESPREIKCKDKRKSKHFEGWDQNAMGPSKRNQEDQSDHMNEPVMLKGRTEHGKHREDASSDDEKRDSRRGRSKLEHWTSHEERDSSISSKSLRSLKLKEMDDKYNNGGSSIASKLQEESSNIVETPDNLHFLGDKKDADDTELRMLM